MEISVAASPSCLAGLRRAVRERLEEAPGDVVDDLVLAVSEAATNAILYGSCDALQVHQLARQTQHDPACRGGSGKGLARRRRRIPSQPSQGLGKVPDCLVHGLVMPSKGPDLGGVAGVVA